MAGPSPRLYERVFRILSEEIAHGAVRPVDLPLTETALAARFGISRAPARRALADLEQAGLIEKNETHGFSVRSGADFQNEAARPDADTGRSDQKLLAVPSWRRIYDEVESEIIARTSFATWRVNEAELARYYGVSRTVARDVIGRLQQRGVVRKDERSRWFAPALTPEHVGELYELRWLLEPVALLKAAPNIPDGLVAESRRKLADALEQPLDVTGTTLDELERDLHVLLLEYCCNATLM
ncbi:MAG TPA: GntR family transcriptional regulator, partial [Chloroflexota bacterium]|nr:GntR family transcriptional regulator [Chloroflexota bacterium]